MEERIPMIERFQEKVHFDARRFLEPETIEFLSLHKQQVWIFSYFSLLFLAVPVNLFMRAIQSFSGFTILDLFLCLLLSLTWVGLPILFLFYSSRENKAKRIWAWVWVALAVLFCVFWGIVLPA